VKISITFSTIPTIKAFNKRHDLNSSLRKLIELIHFDREHPKNHSVYFHDMDAEHAFCMGGQDWERKNTRELAKEIICKAAVLMENHKEHPYDHEYTDEELERFEKFICHSPRDTENLLETVSMMATLSHEVFHTHLVEGRLL
jgi:hypothetical protein